MSTVEIAPDDDKPAEKTEPKFLGLTLGDVVKMGLTALLTLLVTLLIAWLTAKEPHLRFSVSEPIQFQGEKFKVGILNVVITNDGSKEAENVECSMRLEGTKIREVKVSPENLKPSISIKGDKAELAWPMLNPTENPQVSALLDAEMLSSKPDVKVRAKGIVGDSQPKSETSTWVNVLVSLLSVAAALLLGSMVGSLNAGGRGISREQEKLIEKAVKAIERHDRHEKLENIFSMAESRRVLLRAMRHYKPGQRFSVSELAQVIEDSESIANMWIQHITNAATPHKIKVFVQHDDGRYSLSEEAYKMILELIQERGESWGSLVQ
jgi:hypothetical protein